MPLKRIPESSSWDFSNALFLANACTEWILSTVGRASAKLSSVSNGRSSNELLRSYLETVRCALRLNILFWIVSLKPPKIETEMSIIAKPKPTLQTATRYTAPENPPEVLLRSFSAINLLISECISYRSSNIG